MNVLNTQPDVLVNRYLIINYLRLAPMQVVLDVIKESKSQGDYTEVFDEEAEDGKVNVVIKLNYEWLFFAATHHQLTTLANAVAAIVNPAIAKKKPEITRVEISDTPTGKILDISGQPIN